MLASTRSEINDSPLRLSVGCQNAFVNSRLYSLSHRQLVCPSVCVATIGKVGNQEQEMPGEQGEQGERLFPRNQPQVMLGWERLVWRYLAPWGTVHHEKWCARSACCAPTRFLVLHNCMHNEQAWFPFLDGRRVWKGLVVFYRLWQPVKAP